MIETLVTGDVMGCESNWSIASMAPCTLPPQLMTPDDILKQPDFNIDEFHRNEILWVSSYSETMYQLLRDQESRRLHPALCDPNYILQRYNQNCLTDSTRSCIVDVMVRYLLIIFTLLLSLI